MPGIFCLALFAFVLSGCGNYAVIGDSIIFQTPTKDLGVANYGVSGDTSADILARVKKLPPCDALFLEGGLNDMFGDDASRASTPGNYSAILDAQPCKMVYLIGILPINEKSLARDVWKTKLSSENIRVMNARLRELCSMRPNCVVLESPQMATFDGIHPAPKDKEAIREMLRSALY